jgi:hypothetical protein
MCVVSNKSHIPLSYHSWTLALECWIRLYETKREIERERERERENMLQKSPKKKKPLMSFLTRRKKEI